MAILRVASLGDTPPGLLPKPIHSSAVPLYLTSPAGNILVTTAAPVNTLFAVPFPCPEDMVILELAVRVNAGGGAGSVARCGIYQATSPTNIYPRTLIIETGELDTSASGLKKTTISQQLYRGTLYWLAYLAGVAAPSVYGGDTALHVIGHLSDMTGVTYVTKAQAYGAMPALFPASGSWTNGAVPQPLLRRAA